MAHLQPLDIDLHSQLKPEFDRYAKTLGFVPNSVLIMQRKPKIVKALAQLSAAVFDAESGTVELGFKRLIAHMASRASGCQYCMAHNAGLALHLGIEPVKFEALWEYSTNPLYTEAERVALDFALAAASVPNAVDDALFSCMQTYWSDDQIVEITGVISYFGFMNRWNDTMATPLEQEPQEVGEKYLSSHGWSTGKHV
jgi:uncharacterized peroxidase-related enzyme